MSPPETELRVGVDVSPLELTEAGTARYLRNLLSHLDGVTVERYAVPGRSRSAKVRRDLFWYLRTLPRKAARRRRRPPLSGPPRPAALAVPLVVTLHDLAVLRHPETFNPGRGRTAGSCSPRIVEAATRVIAVSSFTAGEAVELLGVDEGRFASCRTVSSRRSSRGAGGPRRIRAGRRHDRAAQEPRRAVEAAQRAGIELRVVGPEGGATSASSRSGS